MESDVAPRFVRSAAVAERQIGEERLLVPVRTSVAAPVEVLALNDTASVLWDLLAQPTDVPSLVAAVCEAFEIDASVARDDVEEFLEELSLRQLIERSTP